MQRDRWLPRVAFVVLSLLLVGTMWVVPYLPTNDGPEWVFAAHAENHYGDPGTIYREVFVPALQYAARGFAWVYGPLDALVGWERGLQVALSLLVLLTAWGFVALVRALDPGRWALGFLGFPLALSWELYMGLWAYVVSTAIGLFVLALAVRLRAPTWKGRALVAALLLVQAVAHVFGAVLTGGALLLLSVARAPRGKRLEELGAVVLTGLPAAGVLVACVTLSPDLSHAPTARGFDRLPLVDALAMLPRTFAPGPLPRALAVTLAIVAAASVAVVRARRDTTSGADRGLGVAAILLLTGVFAPFQIPGWQAFSQRFVPLGVALVIAVLPLERLALAAGRLAPVALFAVSAVWLGFTYPLHRRLAALCPDAIAGLHAPLKLTGTTLPVWLRPTELPSYDRARAEVPMMAPLSHMGALYAAAHGGISAYWFGGGSAIYPFAQRSNPSPRPLPDLEHYRRAIGSDAFHSDSAARREVDDELASFGIFYDEVALFGALPEDLEAWRARGFVADWSRGSALVAHFEPCSIDVTMPAQAPPLQPLFDVRVGKLTLLSDVRVPAVASGDGRAHYVVSPAPCGVVRVRARWEPLEGGQANGCRNANAEGDLVVNVTRTVRAVVCDAQ